MPRKSARACVASFARHFFPPQNPSKPKFAMMEAGDFF